MEKNHVGRKIKEECSGCGIKKTTENTYMRGNGYLFHKCKKCSSEYSRENRMKKMSPEERESLLSKYNLLSTVIKNCKTD